MPENLVITGASGYVGARVLRRILELDAFRTCSVTAVDVVGGEHADDPRVRWVTGDLTLPATLDSAFADGADTVIHLAGMLGGVAERDPAVSRRINIDMSLDIMERTRAARPGARFVFASSIAVYGPPVPKLIDDETRPAPTMLYGAQKLMVEAAVEQYAARGWLDGVAIRLPGIVARPGADARLRSSFLNTVFYAVRDGVPFTMPVSRDGTSWLISVEACARSFIHAALLDPNALDARRAFNLPAQRVRIGDLVDTLEAHFGRPSGLVTYAPDPELEAQFADQPPLETPRADALGFQHDGDLPTLVREALAES